MNFMKIRQLALALSLAVAAPFAAAAFQPGMSLAQVAAEVKAQLAAKATLLQIVQEALAAKVDPAVLNTVLVNAGFSPEDVVAAFKFFNITPFNTVGPGGSVSPS